MDFKKILPLIITFLSLGCLAFIKLGEDTQIIALTREDGLIESITALFFLISTGIGVYTITKSKWLLLPILWTLACFIFVGEETSWFQRIFDYSVPMIERSNAQKEFNLHNLDMFDHGEFTEGSDYLSDLFKSQNLFRMGFFGYFLVLPLLFHVGSVKKLLQKMGYKRPENLFVICFLLVFILSFAFVINLTPTIKGALAETREMLYALFIMAYMFIYIKPLRQLKMAKS